MITAVKNRPNSSLDQRDFFGQTYTSIILAYFFIITSFPLIILTILKPLKHRNETLIHLHDFSIKHVSTVLIQIPAIV